MLRPGPRNNGGVSAVTFFLQLSMVAVPQGKTTLEEKVRLVGQVRSQS
jgi:hypothetical protein